MTIFRKVYNFFDILEDKIRGFFSHYPLVYGLIGGVGVVLFWRGVWHGADTFGLSPLASIVLGLLFLLPTGLMVSVFIGEQIILSGLKHEKKTTDKTKEEVEEEENILRHTLREVEHISKELEEIEKEVKIKK